MTTLSVGKPGDIPEGGVVIVRANDRDIAVFFHDGVYSAIDDRCPHAGASLSEGRVAHGCVTCPWHAWRFRLSDGAWVDNPRVKTGSYPVSIVAGEILIDVPAG